MEDVGARPRASPQVGALVCKVTYVEVQLHPKAEHLQVSTEVFQDDLGDTENWREEKWLTQKQREGAPFHVVSAWRPDRGHMCCELTNIVKVLTRMGGKEGAVKYETKGKNWN